MRNIIEKNNHQGLYVHIPFCRKKCYYCSYVVAVAQGHHSDSYLDCVLAEAQKFQGLAAQSVYIGGGTPSVLNPKQLKKLFEGIRRTFAIAGKCEITLEANPEDIDRGMAECLFDLGVNRLSLGAQSFNNHRLKFLGRVHDARQTRRAFDYLRKAGFQNINLDCIYSFKDQSLTDIKQELQELVNLESEHISIYTLSVERHSRFFVSDVSESGQESQAEHYVFVVDFLKQKDYAQYEISNFSRKGKESKHNCHYWQGGDYIGLGVAAHSHHQGTRSWNVARLKEYIKRIESGQEPCEGKESLTKQQRLTEAVLFGLRLNKGIALDPLEQKFRCRLSQGQSEYIKTFLSEGLLQQRGRRIQTTLKGRLVLDEICSYLV